MDDPGQAMAGQRTEGGDGARVAAAAEPLWGTGAVGRQRARLAEGRGEKLYLIAMIDAAASRLFARFARHDRGEHETAVELPGEVRTAAGV